MQNTFPTHHDKQKKPCIGIPATFHSAARCLAVSPPVPCTRARNASPPQKLPPKAPQPTEQQRRHRQSRRWFGGFHPPFDVHRASKRKTTTILTAKSKSAIISSSPYISNINVLPHAKRPFLHKYATLAWQ